MEAVLATIALMFLVLDKISVRELDLDIGVLSGLRGISSLMRLKGELKEFPFSAMDGIVVLLVCNPSLYGEKKLSVDVLVDGRGR
uniref:Uncharacterized protein n=1 Tax=Lepeophtheirus salmonis TaxID=72036 RepID=A0A0K2SYT4_LEPSM